jgi:hypothetical protein
MKYILTPLTSLIKGEVYHTDSQSAVTLFPHSRIKAPFGKDTANQKSRFYPKVTENGKSIIDSIDQQDRSNSKLLISSLSPEKLPTASLLPIVPHRVLNL